MAAKTGIPATVRLLCLGWLCFVSTAHSNPFALVSITNTTFIGNDIIVDSFDSADPHHSDWQTNYFYHGQNYGTYPASPMAASGDTNTAEPYKRKDNAVVATDASYISIENASVAGWVDTAPGGLPSVANHGSVGDVNWVFNMFGSGIEPGHVSNDMNAVFPNVVPPTANWTNTTATTITNSNSHYKFSSEVTSSLYIKGTNIVIWLAGGLSLSGTNNVTLELNSDVTFYVDGQFSLRSGATVNNNDFYAPVFSLYGLPDCSLIELSATGKFTGIVYAPDAAFSYNGGGASAYDFVGAIVAGTIYSAGHVNFHYDEGIGRSSSFPTIITEQPQSCIAAVGSNVTFCVSISGSTNVSYQWIAYQNNWSPQFFLQATNQTLTLTNVQLTDAGSYAVAVSSPTGLFTSITSSVANLIVYTNAAATLTSPVVSTNGLQFGVTGVAGLDYVVQASTNLTDWISLVTNQPPFSFVDTNTSAFSQRFYRVACFPP